MAKKVVKKAPAADLKKGDMRSQVLNKGKPQPAVDLKQSNPRDLRNKALREANKKANKVKAKPQVKIDFEKIIPEELRKPGGPDIKRPKSNVPRPGKAPWAPRVPKVTTGVTKAVSSAASSVAAGYLKTAAKRLPLLDIVNPNFMNYKTEAKLAAEKQSASPPKYGRSLKAEAEARKKAAFGTGGGNPKTVNPYRKPKNIVGNNPNRGLGTSKPESSAYTPSGSYFVTPKKTSGMTGNGRLRPEVKKKKSAIEEAYTLGNGAQGKAPPNTSTSAQAPKAAVAKKPAFKGNWTGAAATEMQKRGGAKIKRPNLLSLFRKKK